MSFSGWSGSTLASHVSQSTLRWSELITICETVLKPAIIIQHLFSEANPREPGGSAAWAAGVGQPARICSGGKKRKLKLVFEASQLQKPDHGSPGGRSAGRASRDRDSRTRERFVHGFLHFSPRGIIKKKTGKKLTAWVDPSPPPPKQSGKCKNFSTSCHIWGYFAIL